MRGHAQTLQDIAFECERRERALERLSFCFDVYLEFNRDGREETAHMDAIKSIQQLENAICNVLGLPESNGR